MPALRGGIVFFSSVKMCRRMGFFKNLSHKAVDPATHVRQEHQDVRAVVVRCDGKSIAGRTSQNDTAPGLENEWSYCPREEGIRWILTLGLSVTRQPTVVGVKSGF
jgi:hypothetical protein